MFRASIVEDVEGGEQSREAGFQGFGFRAYGLGFRVKVDKLGFRASGLGFRLQS